MTSIDQPHRSRLLQAPGGRCASVHDQDIACVSSETRGIPSSTFRILASVCQAVI